MNLYEIMVPITTNAGVSYQLELAIFQGALLRIAGGYTRLRDTEGAWRDPKDGKVYRDVMQPYRVACSPENFRAIRYQLARLFADQEAFMWARIGEAEISTRDVCLAAEGASGKDHE